MEIDRPGDMDWPTIAVARFINRWDRKYPYKHESPNGDAPGSKIPVAECTNLHSKPLAGTRSEAQSNVARLANYFRLGAVSKVMEFISQLSDSTEFVGLGVAPVVTLGTSITCVPQEVGSIGSVHHNRSPVSGDRQVRRR